MLRRLDAFRLREGRQVWVGVGGGGGSEVVVVVVVVG